MTLRRTSGNPDVTIVIPTVDRIDGRIASLASIVRLVETGDLDAEVIVSAQGPEQTDPPPDLPEYVTWLFSTHHGVSHARNAGLARARGSAIVFVDDDATVEPDLIRLVQEHHQNGRLLSAGSVAFYLGETRRVPPPDVVPLTALNTNRYMLESALVFDTEALRHAGGFDERIGQPNRRGAEEGAAAVGAISTIARRERRYLSTLIIASPLAVVSHPPVSTPPLEKAWRYGCGAGSLIWLQPSWWTSQYSVLIVLRRVCGFASGLVRGDRFYQRVRWSWLRGFAIGLWSGRALRSQVRRRPDTYVDITTR